MRLYAALGMGHSEVAAWVETISTTPPPPPQQRQRPPPPPPTVDTLRRDCIREKFAAAVNCDKSFLEDYAVFLAARSAVSPPERRPRDHVRENASAHVVAWPPLRWRNGTPRGQKNGVVFQERLIAVHGGRKLLANAVPAQGVDGRRRRRRSLSLLPLRRWRAHRLDPRGELGPVSYTHLTLPTILLV